MKMFLESGTKLKLQHDSNPNVNWATERGHGFDSRRGFRFFFVARPCYVDNSSFPVAQNTNLKVLLFAPDIDECDEATYSCPKFARCENKNGGYECSCKNGYEKTSQGLCSGNELYIINFVFTYVWDDRRGALMVIIVRLTPDRAIRVPALAGALRCVLG